MYLVLCCPILPTKFYDGFSFAPTGPIMSHIQKVINKVVKNGEKWWKVVENCIILPSL